jgi:hypothetical protein
VKRRIAELLRRLANLIDYAGAPKRTHWSFTWEDGEGVVLRTDGAGCRLFYLGRDEYERAFSEADSR